MSTDLIASAQLRSDLLTHRYSYSESEWEIRLRPPLRFQAPREYLLVHNWRRLIAEIETKLFFKIFFVFLRLLSLLMYVFHNHVCVILRVCVNFNVWYIRSYASLGNDNIFVWREQATDYRLLFLKNFVCFISPLAVLPFCISCIAAHLVKWFCSSVMFTHRKPFDALCSA